MTRTDVGSPLGEQFHDGLIATWWSQSEGGTDIDRVHRTIERSGQPVLDAGCGSGRLLIPFLQAGLDVDGCDRSAGMIQVCADRLAAAGLKTSLFTQALHELDLPRRYQTIVVVSTFGIGTSRSEDAASLERLRSHLLPGGTLSIDLEMPWTNALVWSAWAHPPARPRRWRSAFQRGMPDGSVIELRTRTRSFDPIEQSLISDVRARLLRDGRVEREELREQRIRWYLPGEFRLMLERAGFLDLRLTDGDTDEPPNDHSEVVVFEARA